jgi:pimeloyl-CoA synthetase
MGNMKLQACISDDHQFVATQLLAFKDFGYKPVTEMKTYTGKTAEAFAQLF